MKFVTRTEWGCPVAKSPVSAKTDQTGHEVHHSTGTQADDADAGRRRVLNIYTGHMNHTKIKYADIAYNFLIDRAGVVYEGRGWGKRSGANSTTNAHITTCFLGDYRKQEPTQAQYDAYLELIWEGERHGIPAIIKGWHSMYVKTSCPGKNLIDVVPSWRADLEKGADMRYRNFVNVPNSRGEPLFWAKEAVDVGLETGVVKESVEYDWNQVNKPFGEMLTIILRATGHMN